MASGKELRRRIGSVKNTQQITKAMKMVSAAKLRKAQEAILQARPYADGIKKVVQVLVGQPGMEEVNPLFTKRPVKKVNIVLITSDRGLCGAYNSNLNKRAEKIYKEEANKYEKLVFTCIGKRGNEYLKLRKIPVHRHYNDLGKTVTYAKVAAIAEDLKESFINGEYDEIRILFAEFKSAIAQVIRVDTLLPVSTQAEGQKNNSSAEFLYEPSRAEILNTLLPRYLNISLYRAFLESAASEYGARMAAMDNATRNAGEVIKKLRLLYNNVRQANITKELLEITSGAEAL